MSIFRNFLPSGSRRFATMFACGKTFHNHEGGNDVEGRRRRLRSDRGRSGKRDGFGKPNAECGSRADGAIHRDGCAMEIH